MEDEVLNNSLLKEYREEDLLEVATLIKEAAGDEKIWLFEGDMGAGKTTLIKALAKVYGVEDTVTSPTFSLVNEYLSGKNELIYHFDFYRIKDETEALDIGVEDYFYANKLCWIEWPSLIPSFIPDRYLQIDIEVLTESTRKIHLQKHG
jgi:tRNA threonylcarbamoyladenosine biosynthesis protein TsaE